MTKEETKAFFEDIDDHGEFKFWVCPNMCMGFVDWDGDKATCRECGTDNQKIHLTEKSKRKTSVQTAQVLPMKK